MNEETSDKISEQFNAGNYSTVALRGGTEYWQTYAALGLVGKTGEAISGLGRFDHSDARFYSAVASWIAGDDETAVRALRRIDMPHARNLLALILKPKIKVLTQLSFVRTPPHELVTAATLDDRFKIQNIGFHPLDLPNQAYADVRKLYDPGDPPDFYFCQMVEWHFLPPNLQELPCPILAQTSDYDAYIHIVYSWLQIFDELVVTDGTEWNDVHRLVNIPVSTFPKTFGITNITSRVPQAPRDIDVFVSGSVFHPFFPEKAILVHQILKIPHIKVKVLNGFVSIEDYLSLLGASKVCFTYYRRPGGTVTRALDALSMGCSVVVQKGNVLNLFVGEESGVLNYEFNSGDLASAVCKILNSWDEFKSRALKGAEIIRHEFSLPKIASQYLRFLTFLAAKPRKQCRVLPTEQLDQKRFTLSKGCLPCRPAAAQRMQEINLTRWRDRWNAKKSSRIVIDLTREMILEYATFAATNNNKSIKKRSNLLLHSFRLYHAGITQFPHSLVLHFNLIRTKLHFGGPKEAASALKLAEEIFDKPESFWHIDVMEDIFPWDFYSCFFNYRQYLYHVSEHLMRGEEAAPVFRRLILASLHYYVSHYCGNHEHLERAVELDPDFPFYKLRYVQQSMKSDNPDYEKIKSLLIQLAEDSNLFLKAYELLKELSGKNLFESSQHGEWVKFTERVKNSITFIENLEPELLPSLSDSDSLQESYDIGTYENQEASISEIISLILADSSWRKKHHTISELGVRLPYVLQSFKRTNRVIRFFVKKSRDILAHTEQRKESR